ncbi:hypothetical protein Lsed01_02092 [Demequina sediminis]|uniref:Uncharacterized protein n=1 Tax=Demequina sediminis TaxID=1930058 RepID=A0ABP9WKK3_9MICO|nr:hypothetical protein [Demequina sediminis]BDZ61541.1 hypothetical protein GCM10025873_13320 [Demequina sediminis]
MDVIRILSTDGLDALIQETRARGYRGMGPSARADAIVITEICGAADLLRGVGVRHDPGACRVAPRQDGKFSRFAAPAQPSKPVFFPV